MLLKKKPLINYDFSKFIARNVFSRYFRFRRNKWIFTIGNRRIVVTIFIIFIHSWKCLRPIPRYDRHRNSPPFRVRRLKKELRRRKVAEATTLRGGGRYQLIRNLEAKVAVDLLWATKPGLCSSQSSRYPTLIEKQMTWNKEFPGGGGGGGGGPGKMSSTLGALQFLRNAEFISFPPVARAKEPRRRRRRRRKRRRRGRERRIETKRQPSWNVKCSSTTSFSLDSLWIWNRFFVRLGIKKMKVQSVFVSNPFGKLTFVTF